MTNTTAVGVSGTISAALVIILQTLMPSYDGVFWGAVVMVAFSLPAFGVSAVRYFVRLKDIAHEKDQTTEFTSLRGAVARTDAQTIREARNKATGESPR